MKPEPHPTPAAPARARVGFLQITLAVVAIAALVAVLADWKEFKAGFTAGYHHAAQR